MDTKVNDTEPEKSQTKIERSAAYPALTISDALTFVAEVYRNFRSQPTKRDDIIDLIKGSHNRHLAAATYYTLLKREKDKYQVSDLYKTIANPISEKEKTLALLEAFGAPKLNKELIEKFDGDEIPKELKAHLARFHNITIEAAPLAAQVFIENAKFCKVLSESYVLNYKQLISKLVDPNFDILKETKEEDSIDKEEIIENDLAEALPQIHEEEVSPKTETNPINSPLLIPEMLNEDKLRIRVTGNRFAYLIYPLDITKKDINIIRKQLDVLDELATN